MSTSVNSDTGKVSISDTCQADLLFLDGTGTLKTPGILTYT